MAQVKIQQLKELKVFNTLRLSIEVLIEVLTAEVLAAEVLAEVLTEILTELTSGIELKVLLIIICCWDSLKS